MIVDTPTTFEAAQKHCEVTRAHLATPENPSEIERISSVMAKLDDKSCAQGEIWIGLHKQPETGSYTWVTGLPLGSSTWWAPEIESEEGLCVSQSLKTGKDIHWHKRNCNAQLCYICEFIL